MSRIVILSNYGMGLYKFRRELISELCKEHEVIICEPESEYDERIRALGAKLVPCNMERRGTNPIKEMSLKKEYKRILKEIAPDYVITYTIKPNIYGGMACAKLGIPYAVNITGLGSAFEKKGALRSLVISLYKRALKNAKVVFFENKENARVFADLHIIGKDRMFVLNGAGVNLEYFGLKEYPEKREQFIFLFIGRIMQEKGVDELFEAVEKLVTNGHNCKLRVVGFYEESYKERIEEYSKKGFLEFCGFQDDVRPFIEDCNCFVLPSWHEGMANVNLESASTGRPLITSNIPGCAEAVVDGESGLLFEVKNAEDLYSKMEQMISMDRDSLARMGLAGRKHMEDVFDKKKVVKETIDALKITV